MLMRRSPQVWIVCMCFPCVAMDQQTEYVSHGPRESVELESALHGFLPGYTLGIAPRAEILERGMSKDKIPLPYVSKIETWISRVLRPEVKPNNPEEIVMLGIPKLHYNRDYIIGNIACDSCDASDRTKAVEFQADDRRMDLTIHSASVKVPQSGVWSGPEIVAVVTRFLDIPKAKIPHIVVDNHVATVEGIRMYYGRLQCEWNYLIPDDHKRCRWWSDIPFWMTDGIVYVSISTIDWEHGETPPVPVNACLDLTGAVRTDDR